MQQNKLIIWDFDGVIADTEKLWMGVWINYLHDIYRLKQTNEELYYVLAGISEDEKARRVKEHYNINITGKDMNLIMEKQLDILHSGKMELTKNIEILFSKTKNQCIGTGGPFEATLQKVKILGIEKYFNSKNVFSRDMVPNGKPAPDIFLLAAKTLGFEPKNCVVIDDAISGAIAAKKAGMDIISFLEHQHIDKEKISQTLKEFGVTKMANNIKDLEQYL